MSYRCAVYARVSTEKQSKESPEDQVRKCREYADRRGWLVLDQHIYLDQDESGAGVDRGGLNRLLDAAFTAQPVFDVVLVDDTSRLSRSLPDAIRLVERLRFFGVRLLAVSQNIDSEDEQADVLLTVHGLVDSLYVKELAKKIHRGLEGLVLRGLHAGGRCFGYRTVSLGENQGARLVVEQAEAATVRRIFEMYAGGDSLRGIAVKLNRQHVATPRPGTRKKYGTWCPTAIREMLRREIYGGRVVWNRSRWVKVPGTNRRLRRMRPPAEWRTVERPELRIISAALWEQVQQQLALKTELHGIQKHPGLLNRAASSPYLLSGLLRCGACGGNLVLIYGRSGGRNPRYGCPQNFYRGACANKVRVRQDQLEEQLLAGLREQILEPKYVDYALHSFERQVRDALQGVSSNLGQMGRRKKELEAELHRLAAAVAEGGHSSFLLTEIAKREEELRGITDALLAEGSGSLDAELGEIREFVTRRLGEIRRLLYSDLSAARAQLAQPALRAELARHAGEIWMQPQAEGLYIATAEWNWLAGYQMDRARHLTGCARSDCCGGWI